MTADGVETISFLEAADGLMDLFGKCSIISSQQYPASFLPGTGEDLLGGPVFAFVQTDLRNNIAVRSPFPATFPLRPFFFFLTLRIQGVRARYKANESTSETLENLVRAEAREGGTPQGTACLVRLARCAQPLHTFSGLLTNQKKKNPPIAFQRPSVYVPCVTECAG